jgi:hypothetical protein
MFAGDAIVRLRPAPCANSMNFHEKACAKDFDRDDPGTIQK